MNPAVPQPDPLALPAPAWLLWALLLLTFFLHLVPMNLVLGGSLIGAVARVRGRRPDRPHEAALAHLVAKAMPVLMAAAVSLGVAALLFLQVLYGRVFFTSAVVMGWWWLSVVGLLIVAYYAAYLLAFRHAGPGATGARVAWLIAALASVIALIYSSNMTLMLKPAELVARYASSGRGTQLNLSDPTLVPRYLHMVLGAIALSGLAVMIAGAARRTADPAFARWALRRGAIWCVAATALNVVTGVWWIVALPADVRVRFTGSDTRAIGELAAGILLTLAGAAHAWLAAAGRRPARALTTGVGTMLAGIVMMLLTRDTVRRETLALAGFQPVNWVAPQWGAIAVFGLLLLAAVAAIGWMARALMAAK